MIILLGKVQQKGKRLSTFVEEANIETTFMEEVKEKTHRYGEMRRTLGLIKRVEERSYNCKRIN